MLPAGRRRNFGRDPGPDGLGHVVVTAPPIPIAPTVPLRRSVRIIFYLIN
jgi:hypothetical protein